MSVAETVAGLTAFPSRGAGTDAERRAAAWLAHEVASPGREVTVETFWCRPNRALAQAWHVALALAGSLVMVSHPTVGGALVLAALVCLALDGLAGVSPGRRLTPEHASQNVVSVPAGAPDAHDADRAVRVLVTAPYDAGRTGLAHAAGARNTAARLRRLAAGGALTPGWLGWLALAMAWLVVVAIVRRGSADTTTLAVIQLVPSAALVLALAALLQLGGAPYGPAAGDDASGVAVAIALVRALAAAPPPHLRVELVLQGAGDGEMLGLRHHLRAHRAALRSGPVAVIGIAACGGGRPRWWSSDGALWPLRYHPRLRALAARATGELTSETSPGHRGRGTGPALPARLAGLPALTLGALDARGLAPRSHRPGDVLAQLDPTAMDGVLELALTVVDGLDSEQRDATRSAQSRQTARD
jgi:Peptidase family M28